MPSITKQLIGIEWGALTYEGIEDYFLEPKEETDRLEFKSGIDSSSGKPKPGQKNKFSKHARDTIITEVNALLNSSGGLLIAGAPSQKVAGNSRAFEGSLEPFDEKKEEDDLLNILTDSMSPMPEGIRVRTLANEADDKFIYLVEVQDSLNKPYQFRRKGSYHIRVDTKTVPAPHHYIEALMKQIRYPKLFGTLAIVPEGLIEPTKHHPKRFLECPMFNLQYGIVNESVFQIAKEVRVELSASKGIMFLDIMQNSISSSKLAFVGSGRLPKIRPGRDFCMREQTTVLFYFGDVRDFWIKMTYCSSEGPTKVSMIKGKWEGGGAKEIQIVEKLEDVFVQDVDGSQAKSSREWILENLSNLNTES